MAQERITETDRKALAFIAHFPGADTDCVTQSLLANRSRFDTLNTPTDSRHPTKNIVSRRLTKLARLGAIQSWRSPAAHVTHHGILDAGYDALEMFGEAPIAERGISQKTGTSLMHYRDIAAVAAQLMHGEYANPEVTKKVGAPLPLDAFITDQSMHSAVSAYRKQDEGFNLYLHISNTLAGATSEELADPAFWATQPELMVLTASSDIDTKHRTHRPDMVVISKLGNRRAIEIERSAKPVSAYIDTFRLFHQTIKGYESLGSDKPVAPVQTMIWLCANKTIKNALTKAANAVDPKLISTGRVIIADLTNADGTPLVYGDTVPTAPRRAAFSQKVTGVSALRPPKLSTSPKA